MRALRLTALLSLALVSAAVSAAVHQRHLITYYSDPGKTTIVGMTMTTCKANTYTDGETTPYYTIVSEDCSTGPDVDWSGIYLYCSYFDGPPLCP
jgi:hypothetical protein